MSIQTQVNSYNRGSRTIVTFPHHHHPLPILVLVVGCYAGIFSIWQAVPVPGDVFLGAILVFATAIAPLVWWQTGNRAQLPMVETILVAYALHFSTPIFTQPNMIVIFSQEQLLPWPLILEALLLAEVGILALIVGYYGFAHSRLVHMIPRLDLPIQAQRRTTYYRFGLALGSGLLLLESIGLSPLQGNAALGAFQGLLTSQFSLALVLLAYEVFASRQVEGWKRVLLYSGTVVGFATGLITGMIENALIPFVLLFLVRWQVSRHVPWHWIAGGILIFALLNPAKTEYRRLVWYSGEGNSAIEKADIWVDAIRNNLDGLFTSGISSGEALQTQLRQPFARVNLIHKLAWVRMLTPDYVSYFEGKTYSYFFVAWIPRFIWPEKPIASSATTLIDVSYRFKLENQNSGSINIGQLAEAYANFGVMGVFVIMLLQGVVYASLNVMLNSPQSDGGRAIYLTQMVFFLNGLGSTMVIVFGALLQHVLANAFILHHFSGDRRQKVRTSRFPSYVTRRRAIYARQLSSQASEVARP